MTHQEIAVAVAQMRNRCRRHTNANGMVSARDLLQQLGYTPADQIQVLQAIADAGFNYCLDSAIPGPNGQHHSRLVCYWGADQLLSRLQSLRGDLGGN